MTKDQRKIKELTNKVTELEKQVKDEKYWHDYYAKECSQLSKDAEQVHATLTLMGIPKENLSISNRLVLLMTKIGLNSVITLKTKNEEEVNF